MDGRVEWILIDIDGCLLPTNGNVPPLFYSGLQQISIFIRKANQGRFPPIGFCTGRDRNYVEAVAFFLGLPNFWSVIESGVALFNPRTKELVSNPALTKETKLLFEEIARERIPQILKKFPDLILYPGNMICVALERKREATITIEEAYEITQEEMSDLLELNLVRITHSDCAVDISPVGIDKASGITFLAQLTGIDLKRVLGIGDSNGDFPLFSRVGATGCPANASESCKSRVKIKKGYISPYKYSRGVADVIAHFIKEG